MINEKNSITYDQETELAQIFRPNTHIPIAVQKIKAFLKHPEVQKQADNDLMLSLQNNNIDIGFVVRERKRVYEESVKAKQFNAANIALDRMEAQVLPKVTVTETRTINSNLTENFDEAKKQMQGQTKKITVSTDDNKTIL